MRFVLSIKSHSNGEFSNGEIPQRIQIKKDPYLLLSVVPDFISLSSG